MNTITHYTVRHIQGEDLSGRFDYWEKAPLERMTDAQAIEATKAGNIATGDVEQLDAEPQDLALFVDDGAILVFRACDGRLIHDTSAPITLYTYAEQCTQAGAIAQDVGPDWFEDDPTDDHVEHVGTRAELIEQARHDLARDYTDRTGRFERQTARAILAHLDAEPTQ